MAAHGRSLPRVTWRKNHDDVYMADNELGMGRMAPCESHEVRVYERRNKRQERRRYERADAVSPSGEIEALDIKRTDSSSGRNGGKGGRNGGRREYKPFPGWLYGVLFVVFDMAAVAALQWGVSQSGTRVQLSSPVVGWGFVSKMWIKGNFVFVLNLLLIGALYLALLMLFNRFWIATPVLLAVAIIVGVIEHFKVSIRYEAILPSDLGFLGSNTGNLMSFTPPGPIGSSSAHSRCSWCSSHCSWCSTMSMAGMVA